MCSALSHVTASAGVQNHWLPFPHQGLQDGRRRKAEKSWSSGKRPSSKTVGKLTHLRRLRVERASPCRRPLSPWVLRGPMPDPTAYTGLAMLSYNLLSLWVVSSYKGSSSMVESLLSVFVSTGSGTGRWLINLCWMKEWGPDWSSYKPGNFSLQTGATQTEQGTCSWPSVSGPNLGTSSSWWPHQSLKTPFYSQ